MLDPLTSDSTNLRLTNVRPGQTSDQFKRQSGTNVGQYKHQTSSNIGPVQMSDPYKSQTKEKIILIINRFHMLKC